jgi:hypothetical protein
MEDKYSLLEMSLEYGGLFDVGGNWQPPHDSHRTGTDVDVRTELPPGVCSSYPNGRTGVPIRRYEDRFSTSLDVNILMVDPNFQEICNVYGGRPGIHGHVIRGVRTPCNEHIHIDF